MLSIAGIDGRKPVYPAFSIQTTVDLMAKLEKTTPITDTPDEVKEPDPAVTELVLSLASFVSANDVGKDRGEFLRLVAGRILEDLGL
jgi:hypothetical protein